MAVLAVHYLDRAAPVEILRTSLTVHVFLEAAFDIGSDTGVERCIAGFDNIERPGRGSCFHQTG